jgi:N-acyl amino acid synthase of PEP-CTERM/exosortase system
LINFSTPPAVAEMVCTLAPEHPARLFWSHFTPLYADSEALRDQVFRIRHEVFCEEFGFEPLSADQRERDEFDPIAHHFLLGHNQSQQFAGCVRLIVPRPEANQSMLPIARFCWPHLDPYVQMLLQSRARCGEISRLAVRARYRRRQSDPHTPEGGALQAEAADRSADRRLFPFVSFGIYLCIGAALELLHQRGQLDAALIMMEPKLYRNLKQQGFNFQPAGPVIDYHGRRAPFVITEQTLAPRLSSEMQLLKTSIAVALAPVIQP